MWYLLLRAKLNLVWKANLMRAPDPSNFLQASMSHLWALLIDSLAAVGAFAIMGLTALVVHKSVEQLRLWGVPSDLIEGMEILHSCVWTFNAFAMLWLCGSAAIRFCKRVTRG